MIDSGHSEAAPVAAVGLGHLLEDQGDVEGAKAAYQLAIDSGNAESATTARHYLDELEQEADEAGQHPLVSSAAQQEAPGHPEQE